MVEKIFIIIELENDILKRLIGNSINNVVKFKLIFNHPNKRIESILIHLSQSYFSCPFVNLCIQTKTIILIVYLIPVKFRLSVKAFEEALFELSPDGTN